MQEPDKDKPASHRIFFALWPDDELRTAIKKQVQHRIDKLPAKRVPVHNWHITLAFLGNVSAETKDCVQQQAALVEADSFALTLDQVGYFKRARVAWLGCSEVPQALNNLFDGLNEALQPCGYQSEHATLIPHMTLLRKANKKPRIDEFKAVDWPVNDFVLVESEITDRGSTYKVINRWNLVS